MLKLIIAFGIGYLAFRIGYFVGILSIALAKSGYENRRKQD